MKKLTKHAIIVLLTISAIVSCGRGGNKRLENPQARNVIKSVIAISDSILAAGIADTINLGILNEGDIVQVGAKLYNAGNKSFVVTRVEKTCGCVDLQYPKAPLKPGEYGEMPMRFNTKGLQGIAYKTVVIQTSLNAKQHILIFKAEINE